MRALPLREQDLVYRRVGDGIEFRVGEFESVVWLESRLDRAIRRRDCRGQDGPDEF